MRILAAAAIAALLPACFHVDVTAPGPTAPAQARIDAFRRLRPIGEHQTIAVTTSANGAVSVSSSTSLILGDGTEVTHADDLLPVLPAESVAAHAARASGDARQHKWAWMLIGDAVGIVGLGLLMSGMNQTDPNPQFTTQDQVALAMGIGGPLVGTIGYFVYNHDEHSRRAAAFATYQEGLTAQLNLCVSGLNMVPCETVAAPTAPAAPASSGAPGMVAPTVP
jgi:hypothetical protein